MFATSNSGGYRIAGHTAAVEDGRAWAVRYLISVDARWITRAALVWGWWETGERHVSLEADGSGHWQVNGGDMPELDGCLDVDLESSACTNLLPLRRLRLDVGQMAEVPSVYVRAPGLEVRRLEQQYHRAQDGGDHQRYDYRAPAFNFESRIEVDGAGLVVEYPGIASRVL